MKIAFLCPSYLPTIGGLEIVAHNLASVLHSAHQQDVSMIVPWKNWRAIKDLVPYRVLPFVPYSDRLHFILRNYGALASLAEFQLAAYQQQYGFDLWHVHTTYPSGGFAAHFLQTRGRPRLLTCHGYDIRRVPEINYGTRLDPAKDLHIRKTVLQYPRIVAISNSIRQELLACDVKPEHIADIPNGADIHRIQNLDVDKNAVRTKLGIPSGHKMLISVGRNQPVKGFDLIPTVIAELLKSRDDFVWVLVGPGSEQIEQLAIAAGVEAHLRCLPATGGTASQAGFAVPNHTLIQYYKSADLYVATSRSEGFGMSLIEAMAAGLPLVSTDATGCRDIVNPKVGYTSPVDDTVALAQNILHIFAEPEQLAAFKENTLVQSQEYDWSIIGKRYMEEYQMLSRQRRIR